MVQQVPAWSPKVQKRLNGTTSAEVDGECKLVNREGQQLATKRQLSWTAQVHGHIGTQVWHDICSSARNQCRQ